MLSSKLIPTWSLLVFMMFLIVACEKDDPGEPLQVAPVITDITPYSGQIGDHVSIFGQNFGPSGVAGSDTSVSYVTVDFNGVSATVDRIRQREDYQQAIIPGEQSISTIVPQGATSGKITVTSSMNSTSAVSPADFLVTTPNFEPNVSVEDALYVGDYGLFGIFGIDVDVNGNYYIVGWTSTDGPVPVRSHIFKLSPSGVDTIVSNLFRPSWASSDFHYGLTVDKANNVYAPIGHTICKISPDGQIDTIAGSGVPGFVDGPAVSAQFLAPWDLDIDDGGNIYVTGFENHAIRKIATDGTVTTLAGGSSGYTDGWGSMAQFFGPLDIAIGPQNNIYLTELGNSVIRKITAEGLVSTFAGGKAGYFDSNREEAHFSNLRGLVIDDAENIYVVDSGNKTIRKISMSGQVTTVAEVNARWGLAVDEQGNLHYYDEDSKTIRKIVFN
ncbi:MAG: IPT/TIG domain-containing protein [Bacteroidia bacterium]|nr:IPT/TIG domain-containing protein [Bacteroidia bacterium]